MTADLDAVVARFGLFVATAQVDDVALLGLGSGLLCNGGECRRLGDGLVSGGTTSTGSWPFCMAAKARQGQGRGSVAASGLPNKKEMGEHQWCLTMRA